MNNVPFKWVLDLALDWLAISWVRFFRTGSQWVDQTFALPDPATTPPAGARALRIPLGFSSSPTPVPRAVVDLVVGRAGPDLNDLLHPLGHQQLGDTSSVHPCFLKVPVKTNFQAIKQLLRDQVPKLKVKFSSSRNRWAGFYENQFSISRDIRDQKWCTEIAHTCS